LPIGMVTANRFSAENEAVIGFCENMLTLRTRLSGDLSFRELLGQVREVVLQARMHQELPFEYLIKELHPTCAPGHNPFFQVMLTLTPPLPALPPEWTVTRMEASTSTTRYDLNLNVEERAEGLLTCIEYSSDLFDEATIVRMAGHWQ